MAGVRWPKRRRKPCPLAPTIACASSFGNQSALLELTLETGRQHQIRLHLASIGHPVLDDRVYGPAGESAKRTDRPLLHAWRLAFPHPLTGHRVAVEAPLPRDFRARLKGLRADVPGDGRARQGAPRPLTIDD